MNRDYWICTKSGEIVNCVNTDSREKAERVAAGMIGDLHIEEHPPIQRLKAYRYWDERP